MYQGIRNKTLASLAERLQNEKLLKRDLVLPSEYIEMHDGRIFIDDLPQGLYANEMIEKLIEGFDISLANPLQFEMTEVARRSIAKKLSIPVRYFRFLEEEHVDLLDENVTTLFSRAQKNYFVRTFAPADDDGSIGLFRALLSDRYQVVDNLDVLYASLQAIRETGANVEVANCNLSEKRMYVEFINRDANITAEEYLKEYKSPDGGADPKLYSGFVISNSEVGSGSYSITPRAIVGACQNGLLFKRDAMRKTHLGSQMDEGIKWSQKTLNKELSLVKSQITDAVSHFMSKDFLIEKVEDMASHTGRLNHPIEATENVCSEIGITEDEKKDVLNYFIDSGDFSPVGVAQALTYHAHEQPDADKQYEIEANAIDVLPRIAEQFDIKNN